MLAVALTLNRRDLKREGQNSLVNAGGSGADPSSFERLHSFWSSSPEIPSLLCSDGVGELDSLKFL